jgi:hypothetical protein
VRRNLDGPTLVVYPSLDSAMYAADGEHVGLVEVRDRLVVLTLSILDHELTRRVVGVHRQATSPISSRVADQPIEAVLAARGFAEDRVAQIDNVSLVRVRAMGGHDR